MFALNEIKRLVFGNEFSSILFSKTSNYFLERKSVK